MPSRSPDAPDDVLHARSSLSPVARRGVTNVFRHSVAAGLALQLAVELACLFGVAVLAFQLQAQLPIPLPALAIPALVLALLILLLNVTLGLYRKREKLTSSSYLVRVLLAPAIGVPLASVLVEYLPGGRPLQENLPALVGLTFVGLLVVRHAVVLPLITAFVPHRVLVLGTGPEARLVEASLAGANLPDMTLVGFYALEKEQETVVSPGRVVARSAPLEDTVRQLGIHEIIVAVRQQRGGVLPLRALLDCRLRGIQVTDLARFFERVHGQVPIESLKVSWLIYGDGYRQNWLRSARQARVRHRGVGGAARRDRSRHGHGRRTDRDREPRPRHLSPGARRAVRARSSPCSSSAAWRATPRRTARRAGRPSTTRASRVSARLLRRSAHRRAAAADQRARGEMSFVGPRPERPEFVAMLTEQIPFYAVRHSVKPGLTGWAQVRYSYGATIEQSVKKLEYDLYYVKNHTLLLDLVVLLETIRVVLLGEGAR